MNEEKNFIPCNDSINDNYDIWRQPDCRICRWNTTEAAETSESTELPIKPLTAKIVDENPYMAKSDSNIHHDCYNTDSTDEVLLVDIYSEINVSYEKTNPNASPAIFFDTYGHAVVPFLCSLHFLHGFHILLEQDQN